MNARPFQQARKSEDKKMSAATSSTQTLDRTSMILGTAMMLGWTLGLGILGFALLLAVAYAMLTHSYALAVAGSVLLFMPLFLTIAWGMFHTAATLERSWSLRFGLAGPTWWERRQAHRILYQAYFL
jgi:hypothetical protein